MGSLYPQRFKHLCGKRSFSLHCRCRVIVIIIIIIIIMKFETLVRHLSGYWLDDLYSTPDRSRLEFFFVFRQQTTLWLAISLMFRVPRTLSPETKQPDRNAGH